MKTTKLLAIALAAGALALAATSAVRAGAPTGPKPGDVPPEITVSSWLNSPPLTLKGLRGRAVLLEFWSPG